MSKRTRIDECCSYMNDLSLSTASQLPPDITRREAQSHRTIDELQLKIYNIEQSASTRFDYLDNKISDVNTKLDKLINLVTNISDNQLFIVNHNV